MRNCLECGFNIDHKKSHAKYCSKPCKSRFTIRLWNKANPGYRDAYNKKYRAALKALRAVGTSVRELAIAAGYRSGFERTLSASLTKRKVKFGYETLKLPYFLNHVYNPDFILDNGVIIEAKGKLTQQDRSKMIAVKKCHPDLDIRFVFMRGANTLSAKSKVTYMQWAAKNGFPAADGDIPNEWLA